MPNDYFRFKQFTIRQDRCAMKVCTDACLFGAWVSKQIQNSKFKIKNALDIGGGTGVLSLMLAQENSSAFIDAVEINETAAEQAKENFEASPWAERLNVYNVPLQQFISTSTKYDVVICNPPFYENDLKSDDEQRNLALHGSALSLKELIIAVDKILKDHGSFFVLLPYHRRNSFEQLAADQHLYFREKIFIKQTPKHDYFRTMFWLTKKVEAVVQSELTIMNENKYTAEFSELLKDYYLYL